MSKSRFYHLYQGCRCIDGKENQNAQRKKKKQLLACQLTGFLTLDSVKSGTGTRDNYLMD